MVLGQSKDLYIELNAPDINSTLEVTIVMYINKEPNSMMFNLTRLISSV